MKLSAKRKSAIYGAIHEQITRLRIELRTQMTDAGDFAVAQKVTPIYRDVLAALGENDPHA